MKYLVGFIALFFALHAKVYAQAEKTIPVTWNVKVERVENGNYVLVAEAKMAKGFHIWALDAGGDGSLINTEISDNGDDIEWRDEVWNTDKLPKTESLEFIDGDVHYFEGKVKLSRAFSLKNDATSVSVMVTFQSCNESMCFPPQDQIFTLKLGDETSSRSKDN